MKIETKRITLLGILISLSMIFSYVETLIPFMPSVQGIKLGLANVVVLFCLYRLSIKDAFLVLILRIILVGFIFTSLSAMLYSLAGGILSFTIMVFLKKSGIFSIVGVSCAGGVAHNIGQICMAIFILQTDALFSYLPILIASGCISGFCMGLICMEVNKRVKDITNK